MTSRWYLIRVKINQDHLAARGLREQGFEVYLAKKFERMKISGAHRALAELRLSPYIFVRFDVSRQEHGPISNTRGVSELFCNKEGNPRAIPDDVIFQLRDLEDAELEAAKKPKKGEQATLPIGAQVRIDRHAHFVGLQGLLTGLTRGVALIIVGTVLVEIPECDVSVIEKAKKKPR